MRSFVITLITVSSIALMGCREDDKDNGNDTDIDTSSVTDDTSAATDDTDSSTTPDDTETADDTLAIEASWVSEGDDISPLFAGDPFNYTRVFAVFDNGGNISVTATDSSGTETSFSGTYEANDATNPGTITVYQTAPYAATSEGIWQVDGDTLTYEVVQTDPDYGFLPPTPESGFGTTGGVPEDTNIQIYQRP